MQRPCGRTEVGDSRIRRNAGGMEPGAREKRQIGDSESCEPWKEVCILF